MRLPLTESQSVRVYRLYRAVLWRLPWAHALLLRLRGRRPDYAACDLVVEGFARSGNTFVTVGLELSQAPGLRVESHLHVPYAVAAARRAGTPICLVIRHPDDAVPSLVQHSQWSVLRALDHYIAYHEIIEAFVDDLTVCEFGEFTADFNTLLGAVNADHGLGLVSVDHEDLTSRVFEEIEARQLAVQETVDELTVHRPSTTRASNKAEIVDTMYTEHPDAAGRAVELYRRFAAARSA